MLIAGSAQADVFNMGGTYNQATGTWTGAASLEFVTVGDPGNATDPATGSLYGSVGYVYQMGKYDVTIGQYCQFLNAVATTSDTYGLYSPGMATNFSTARITQSGSPGSYSYSVTGSYSQGVNCPIFDVSWGDAARFCNWLQNGQPVGSEGNGTTETGAYTLNGAVTDSALMGITRNAGATYFIPSENEWYKAAYYKGGGTNAAYWLYPTQSNSAPGETLPDTGNNANYDGAILYGLTPIGAFSASPGPYGTYDMGGDVYQWNEATKDDGSTRGMRGGSWLSPSDYMQSTYPGPPAYPPTATYDYIGFRVAGLAVPEPASIALLVAGGLCLLAYAWRRRV